MKNKTEQMNLKKIRIREIDMRKRIRRFESMMWLLIKLVLYVILMAIFIMMLAPENI